MSLAGERLGGGTPAGDGNADWARGMSDREVFGIGTGSDPWPGAGVGDGGGRRPESREVTGRDFLTGASFAATGGTAEGGFASAWGRGAITRFDGRDGELSVGGEVATGMLGADFFRERWSAGVVVSESRGTGTWSPPDGTGELSAQLTAVHPWAGFAVTDRLSAWAAAGYGAGSMTVTPDGDDAMETDISYGMTAAGAEGALLEGADGTRLALTGDVRATRTGWDRATGLVGGDAATWRVRISLEGERRETAGGDPEHRIGFNLKLRW